MIGLVGVMEFHSWLREQIKKSGTSQTELAYRTGYSAKTIEAYIYGARTPSRQGAIVLAEVLEVPVNEVLGLLGFDPQPDDEGRADDSPSRDRTALRYTRATSLTQFTIVPVIGSVSVEGRRVSSQVEEVLQVRAQDLESIARPAIVFMPDGSMAGRGIEPGDQLLIEQVEGSGICPEEGDIAVVYTAGEKYAREWWPTGDGAILRAAAEGYKSLRITGQQFEDMEAVVVGIVRKVLRVWDV